MSFAEQLDSRVSTREAPVVHHHHYHALQPGELLVVFAGAVVLLILFGLTRLATSWVPDDEVARRNAVEGRATPIDRATIGTWARIEGVVRPLDPTTLFETPLSRNRAVAFTTYPRVRPPPPPLEFLLESPQGRARVAHAGQLELRVEERLFDRADPESRAALDAVEIARGASRLPRTVGERALVPGDSVAIVAWVLAREPDEPGTGAAGEGDGYRGGARAQRLVVGPNRLAVVALDPRTHFMPWIPRQETRGRAARRG